MFYFLLSADVSSSSDTEDSESDSASEDMAPKKPQNRAPTSFTTPERREKGRFFPSLGPVAFQVGYSVGLFAIVLQIPRAHSSSATCRTTWTKRA